MFISPAFAQAAGGGDAAGGLAGLLPLVLIFVVFFECWQDSNHRSIGKVFQFPSRIQRIKQQFPQHDVSTYGKNRQDECKNHH